MEDQEIEWNDLFTDNFDSAETFSNHSPADSVSDWVAEIENMLFNDEDGAHMEPTQTMLDNYFSDVLVGDTPIVSDDLASNEHLLDNFFSDASPIDVAPTDKKSPNLSDESAPLSSSEDEKASDEPEVNNSKEVSVEPEVNNSNDENRNNGDVDDDADDPVSRKRRRQVRNRDAAMRSRERKKMYVKDLEMKSKYLEGECRRLGRLLQCVVAENQALHFTLQRGNAFGASLAKQESAVLFLESLLLGSLLWFLGIMCLFNLPQLTLSSLESAPLVQVEEKAPEKLALREPGSEHLTMSGLKSRRCKASRTKMKLVYHVIT